MKDPEGTARSLKQSIDQGNQVADTFKATVENERANFKTQYDSVLGERAKAAVDPKPIAAKMRELAAGQTQHELTPTFKNFLLRKADEIDPPATALQSEPGAMAQIEAQKRGITDRKQLLQISKEAREKAAQGPSFTAQQARDLNTELHESAPSGQTATNLDKKAAATLNDAIKQQYEDALRKGGATEEQIGRLQGIDKDYAMFQKTINGLRPDRADFGEQTADAFFQTAQRNPTLALKFADMANRQVGCLSFAMRFLSRSPKKCAVPKVARLTR
jgi:hypothetical protein